MPQPNYELLKDAYAIIGGIPKDKMNLDSVVTRRGDSLECGTICCAFGWLSLHPQFAPLLNMQGRICAHYWIVNGKRHDFYANAAAALFGISHTEAQSLFGFRGESRYDGQIKDKSDRDVWLSRVRIYLKEKGAL